MSYDATPLIPRRVFFGNPDRAQVTISPDGEHLAWLAPRDGVLNVWVAPRERPADALSLIHICRPRPAFRGPRAVALEAR